VGITTVTLSRNVVLPLKLQFIEAFFTAFMQGDEQSLAK
jgi:hypothetical protein